MSHNVHEDRYYNENIKKEYIESHKEATQKNLERIFKITAQSEFDLDKELFTFTREELRRMFYTFMASTPRGSKTNVQQVTTYLDWAVDKGYARINPLESVDVSWKEQFVIKPEKIYWTDVEVKSMLKEIVNAQVAVVFYAPFVGIRGQGNSEIVNLKKSDIDADNLTVKLIDEDKSTREIKVDHEFIRLCQQAIKEDEYIKSNGNPDGDIRSEVANLIENDYVVRSVDIGVKNHNEADGMIVYRRFVTVSTFFGEEKLNPTTMTYSGMLAMAKDLYVSGELNKEGYDLIAKQFNLNESTLKRHKADFLNVDGIKSLYELS